MNYPNPNSPLQVLVLSFQNNGMIQARELVYTVLLRCNKLKHAQKYKFDQ